MDFERELDANEDGKKVVKIVKRTLFPSMNPYPQKKVLTFNKHNEDFAFYVNYGNMSTLPEAEVAVLGSKNLSKVQLNGIAATLAKHKDDEAEFKGIKAHFAIDDSGLISLTTVESTFEKVHPVPVESEPEASNSTQSMLLFCTLWFSTVGKMLNIFLKHIGDAANNTDSSNATEKNTTTTTKTEKKPKIEIIKEEVGKEQTILDLQELVGPSYEVSQKR